MTHRNSHSLSWLWEYVKPCAQPEKCSSKDCLHGKRSVGDPVSWRGYVVVVPGGQDALVLEGVGCPGLRKHFPAGNVSNVPMGLPGLCQRRMQPDYKNFFAVFQILWDGGDEASFIFVFFVFYFLLFLFFFFFLSLPGFSIQLHVLLPSGRCMVNNGLCTPRPWILAVSQSELIQRASTHWVTAVSQSSPFLHVILWSLEEVLLGAKKHFQGDFHVYEDGLSVSTHSSLLPW